VLLAAALSTWGCEEVVDPADTTHRVFTVYGHFDPTRDEQAVRVFEIENVLKVTKPEPIDARVFSTDLSGGERIEWEDAITRFADSTYGHVFHAPFTAHYERTYKLEVERSDGRKAEAVATVPPQTEAEIEEPDSLDFDLIGHAFWPQAPSLIYIRVEYLSNIGTFTVHYLPRSEEVDGGRRIEFRFRADTRPILEAARFEDDPVYFRGVVFRAVVASEDWVAPDGAFDANFLVEPGTLTNVSDGFGFVGAGYDTAVFWMPDDGILRAAGFPIEPEP
jgi:hypothetical protein